MLAVNITMPQHKRPPSGGRIRKRLFFCGKMPSPKLRSSLKGLGITCLCSRSRRGKQDNAGNGTRAEKSAESVRVRKLSDGTFKHLADVLVKNEIGLSV